MKSHIIATRVVAGVLPAMALFATPALAQLQTQTTPPPVPAVSAPAPAPAPAAAAPSGASGTVSQQQYQAAVQAATGTTAPADAPAAGEAPARSVTRATPARRAAAAPVATAPAAAPAVAPAPAAAAPEAAAPAAPVAAEPVATAPVTDATTTQTSEIRTTGFPVWGWALVGLAVLAALAGAVIALRRRRERDEWAEEEVYYDEQPVAAEAAVAPPLAAAPVAHDAPVEEHADLVQPEAAEVAAITEGAAPVAGRPWIELSLRPVRAGATDETALVDLELTLANAGAVAAEDVRVSTFMLGDAGGAPTEMDRLLATGHAGAEVDAGAIGAGEGSRIDARLAVPREDMAGATFQPVVVADVRYRLPDGGEGRTAAAFAVGVQDEDGAEPSPLRLGGDMREDVAATLHGVPERV